jgi:predicted RNA-binding protein with TRAM domain
VGYYKNYTIFIAGAEDKVGSKVTAEIEEVNSNKRVATAKIIG